MADAESRRLVGFLLTAFAPELLYAVFLLMAFLAEGCNPSAIINDAEALSMLVFFLVLGHILHIPLTFLLWVYRQSVIRGQRASARVAFWLAVPVACATACLWGMFCAGSIVAATAPGLLYMVSMILLIDREPSEISNQEEDDE